MYGQLVPCSHCGQACGSERLCGERLREDFSCQRCGDGLREHEEEGEWIGWVCPMCDLPAMGPAAAAGLPAEVESAAATYDFDAPVYCDDDIPF